MARWFSYELTLRKIPVRGALSFGDFYSDPLNNLYFWQALVEAYQYGEAQDWVGYMLTPSAVSQMEKVQLPANERLNYDYGPIPLKQEAIAKGLNASLPACILGRWIKLNGKNPCVVALEEMERKAQSQHKHKYFNTLKFIADNHRQIIKRE